MNILQRLIIGFTSKAKAEINTEVDSALDTVIPSPTSGSINERIKAIDVLTEASGNGDLAAILTDTNAIQGLLPASTIAAATDVAGASYRFTIIENISRSLASTGTTNVISSTETGVLIAFAIQVDVGPGGSCTAVLEIATDGEAAQTMSIYVNSTAWHNRGMMQYLMDSHMDGTSTQHRAVIPLGGVRYLTSIRVGINVTASTSSGNLIFSLIRGVEV
jgi:hypothetical protein